MLQSQEGLRFFNAIKFCELVIGEISLDAFWLWFRIEFRFSGQPNEQGYQYHHEDDKRIANIEFKHGNDYRPWFLKDTINVLRGEDD